MPWRETWPMRERLWFVQECRREYFTVVELCHFFGVSPKTGYKWLERFRDEGPKGLEDRSRAPKSCPHRTPAEAEEVLLRIRRRHRDWGPGKIRDYLMGSSPDQLWPARSTIADILRRHGLVKPRRRRPRPGHPGFRGTVPTHPNGLWTADFKGQFRVGNGQMCFPLTVLDGYSRFLLGCQGLERPLHDAVQPVFERLFREFGLPQAIRTDNGTPFASLAVRRLSRLHVWWIKLGITPELTLPGHPQHNASHERFHRTLKDLTARPPAGTPRAQQRAFDRFRQEYNEVRPHEANAGHPPAHVYRPSPRPYPRQLPDVEYPPHFERRMVYHNGVIRWHRQRIVISQVLEGEPVGLEEERDGLWSVYFGPILLGRLDERNHNFRGLFPHTQSS